MTKTVYLPKAEMERLSAAIAKPVITSAFFAGAKKNSGDKAAELIQIRVTNGQVSYYSCYDTDMTFDNVQVGIFKSLSDNSIMVQYESSWATLVIKEMTDILLYPKEEE